MRTPRMQYFVVSNISRILEINPMSCVDFDMLLIQNPCVQYLSVSKVIPKFIIITSCVDFGIIDELRTLLIKNSCAQHFLISKLIQMTLVVITLNSFDFANIDEHYHATYASQILWNRLLAIPRATRQLQNFQFTIAFTLIFNFD